MTVAVGLAVVAIAHTATTSGPRCAHAGSHRCNDFASLVVSSDLTQVQDSVGIGLVDFEIVDAEECCGNRRLGLELGLG